MRLAFCNATRRWGGVKTWTLEFAAALQDKGHDIVIFGRPGSFIERAQAAGLEAIPVEFGPDFNPLAIHFFHKAFRQRAIEAVLVNVGRDLRTAGVAARLLGIPLVQRIGLPGDMENSWKVRILDSLLSPHYLCPCRYIRDGMRERLPWIPLQRTSIVYSAKKALAAAPTMVSSPLRIVSTSQINPNKGHAELAHTLAILAQEGFHFRWDIAGEGSFLEELRTLCLQLGLAPRVTFHGFMQNISELLIQSDIFVLSSYTEGLPNTLLEAMAHGLIPVARDVGGVQECWPPALPFAPVPFTAEPDLTTFKNAATTNMHGTPSALPLYNTLRTVVSAPREILLQWKALSWQHCAENFSLQTQADKLEYFFREAL